MLFSSISFVYFFLPAILVIYFLTPRKYKNVTLLFGSLTFYFIGETRYTLLLLVSTLVDYTHSRIIVKHRGTQKAKRALISSIGINLAMLGVFKYTDFFIMNINAIFGLQIPLVGLDLPIGISFFTFQTMSYTIDVYREEAEVQDSIVGLATYVALFPQLIAGPIVRYKTIAQELKHRRHSFDLFYDGFVRFLLGLGKKVLIANSLGQLADMIYQSNDLSVLFYWLSAIAYALQIYYDFSGYSDMAIGLGKIFGFHFLENFNYPYISRSITEFWRRWHMSLGAWFRDYVYIPLGGNRVTFVKWLRNICLVWFLTGFWHGASWNFILWGISFGILLILEKLWLHKWLERFRILSHIYVLVTLVFSFVIFRNDTMTMVGHHLKSMLGLMDIPWVSREALYYLDSYKILFAMASLGATPLVKVAYERLTCYRWTRRLVKVLEPIFLIGLLGFVTSYLVDASFNPFLYFRF